MMTSSLVRAASIARLARVVAKYATKSVSSSFSLIFAPKGEELLRVFEAQRAQGDNVEVCSTIRLFGCQTLSCFYRTRVSYSPECWSNVRSLLSLSSLSLILFSFGLTLFSFSAVIGACGLYFRFVLLFIHFYRSVFSMPLWPAIIAPALTLVANKLLRGVLLSSQRRCAHALHPSRVPVTRAVELALAGATDGENYPGADFVCRVAPAGDGDLWWLPLSESMRRSILVVGHAPKLDLRVSPTIAYLRALASLADKDQFDVLCVLLCEKTF